MFQFFHVLKYIALFCSHIHYEAMPCRAVKKNKTLLAQKTLLPLKLGNAMWAGAYSKAPLAHAILSAL